MKVLIDGSNLIAGGGVSHLVELLKSTNVKILTSNNIEKVYLTGVSKILDRIPDFDWLVKIPMVNHENNFLKRYWWKRKNYKNIIFQNQIDIVFNPGGSYLAQGGEPYVTMCRNMLVFETKEANRFGFGIYRLKFILLRIFQSLSMKGANGVIFISNYARDYISENYRNIKIRKSAIINHGVSERFKMLPKQQRDINEYSIHNPFKILYVSVLDVYKHHDKLAQAIVTLVKERNLPLEFNVVGAKSHGFESFNLIQRENADIIKFHGKIRFEEIEKVYKDSDLFLFGSTCENMPNILIEAMSSGIPIASSEKQPMPEFLKDGGAYFNVEDQESIISCIEQLVNNSKLRADFAQKSFEYSVMYNWENCSEKTWEFINNCYGK